MKKIFFCLVSLLTVALFISYAFAAEADDFFIYLINTGRNKLIDSSEVLSVFDSDTIEELKQLASFTIDETTNTSNGFQTVYLSGFGESISIERGENDELKKLTLITSYGYPTTTNNNPQTLDDLVLFLGDIIRSYGVNSFVVYGEMSIEFPLNDLSRDLATKPKFSYDLDNTKFEYIKQDEAKSIYSFIF